MQTEINSLDLTIFESAILQKISVMTKNILKTFVAILLFAVILPCISSCGDDLDGCGLTVIAVDGNDNSRIANAKVHVGKNSGTITRDGYTDNHGEIYFFFDNEAIFDITVSYGEAPNTIEGEARVSLKEGQVKVKTVPLY